MPSSLWRHRVSSHAGVATIVLSGELDLASVPAIEALLFEQVQAADVTAVHVDLTEVGFLDSSALGVLVKGWTYAQDEGVDFTVAKTSPAARRILDTTGLDKLLMGPEPA